MKAYKYDEAGLYIGEVECQIDPLTSRQKGETVYLLPGNATYTEPPESKEGCDIVWTGNAWTYVEIPTPPEPEPPHEPTTDEKLAALDAQYEADKDKLRKAYQDAMIYGDTDRMESIKADLAALDAQYDEDYAEIESEGDDDE